MIDNNQTKGDSYDCLSDWDKVKNHIKIN